MISTRDVIAIVNSLTTAPVTKQGESPLAVAVNKRNIDVIKYLVKECNANVNGESSVVVGLAVATQTLISSDSDNFEYMFVSLCVCVLV